MKRLGIYSFLFCLFSLWPLATDSLRFWQIDSAIEIKVQKNSPPFQAFQQAQPVHQLLAKNPITFQRTANLSVDILSHQNIQSAKKIVLLEPIVVKKFKNLDLQEQASAEPLDLSWVSTLPLRQQIRLEEAQSRFAIFDQPPSESPVSRRPSEPVAPSKVEIVKTAHGYEIHGPWEIAGGLGWTNDHSIDLRHSVEGSTRESGVLSVKDGTYNINIASLAGILIAKMYDKAGNVLGEGSLALQEDFLQAGLAPKLIIRPQVNFIRGTAPNSYDGGKNKNPVEGLSAKALQNDIPFENGPDDTLQLSNMNRNSQTVARFEADHFAKSNMLLISGKDFKAPVFPEKMIKALKEIVSEQLSYDLNNPQLPLIWGQVLMDSRPVTGAQVEIEGESDAKVVYFDILNLPDTNLKETSANGYFAIIGAQEGFHALVARRGGQYYAHNVASLEAGAVSIVNLESSLKTKNVPLRVFDAFAGTPEAAELQLQSLEEPLKIDAKGWTSVLLPQVSRLSLMQVNPANQGYLPAQYFYNDDQDFIHVPLVSEDWLLQILQPKWSQIDAEKGTVIGFVQDENFEVYLAGNEVFSPDNITYFDHHGNLSREGIKGGGFIMNNVDTDTHEIVIYGKQTERLTSRLLPVDQKSVSIILFQEN